jgi:hypothetical protein
MTIPSDDPRMALQRAQDEAARRWLEAGAKGRPPWATRDSRRSPVFGTRVYLTVLLVVVAVLIAGVLAL